jgi:F0F1-type ATP synthase delta subunit
MFHPDRWAQAFVNACNASAACGESGVHDISGVHDTGGAEAGLAALKALFAALNRLPAPVSGTFSARQLDGMIRRAIAESGLSAGDRNGGLEMAVRFILLLVRKGFFKYGGKVIGEVETILNRERGILKVRVDAALPPESAFEEALKAALRRKTGAEEILTEIRVVPELLGGCRLLIGSEFWDASLRGQLQSMARDLGASGGL